MNADGQTNLLRKYHLPYIVLRLIRRNMPEKLAHRFMSRRHTPPESVYKTTRRYLDGLESAGLTQYFVLHPDAVVLEAGTGIYNPATAPFLLSGVSRLILLEPFVGGGVKADLFCRRFDAILQVSQKDPAYSLPKIADGPIVGSSASGLPDGIELSARCWEDTGLADDSVDCIFSSSVLEHLRDPDAVLDECARILRPGGFMVNSVDMRDHFFRYPVEMLKFSRPMWERLTTQSGGSGYQNRWRLTHWLSALDERNFSTSVVPHIVSGELIERQRPFFDADFRELPLEDLRVLTATLVSRYVPSEKHQSHGATRCES